MADKRIRHVIRIFTLDKIEKSTGLTTWNISDFYNYLNEQEKHYGLNLISPKEEIIIIVEYQNIIWNYKVYYGSYKNKYKSIINDDERWITIEKQLEKDLKIIGLIEIKEEVLTNLKNKKYFEYKIQIEEQFKTYCL